MNEGPRTGPKYLEMERMEARLRPGQVDALTQLKRNVAAQRANRSERITENTLLRLAVDLLLAHRHQLRGDTEDELRQSILPLPADDRIE
ncbi:hypothetical protein [Saccharopolyspora cebuensis]|uniref:hypothetical protein n=1 Tax=Saccharopolyspora cebuensis TaxID=418759 RepID=UPI0031E8D883